MPLQFKGIYAILATPFDESRKLDLESLRSLVEFEIKAGVQGVTILGILGEVHRLTDEERSIVTRETVKAVNHRVPVISGTGASGTDIAIAYTLEAEKLGVDGVMIAPPRLAKPSDDAVISYFSEIASQASIPIIVQDEPATYGVHLSPELIAGLSRIPRVKYIKLEDPPTPSKISKIRSLLGSNQDNFGVFGGLGGMYAYEELRRGACGLMTGFAYPEVLVRIYKWMQTQETMIKARELFYRVLPLIRYEAQPMLSLPLRKEILRRRGAIKYSTTRPPTAKLSNLDLKELDELLSSIKPEEVEVMLVR